MGFYIIILRIKKIYYIVEKIFRTITEKLERVSYSKDYNALEKMKQIIAMNASRSFFQYDFQIQSH